MSQDTATGNTRPDPLSLTVAAVWGRIPQDDRAIMRTHWGKRGRQRPQLLLDREGDQRMGGDYARCADGGHRLEFAADPLEQAPNPVVEGIVSLALAKAFLIASGQVSDGCTATRLRIEGQAVQRRWGFDAGALRLWTFTDPEEFRRRSPGQGSLL